MATWLSHMRVAEFFISKDSHLNPIEFLVGNIAPDCGVPDQDWKIFTPEKHITHWQLNGKTIEAEDFKEKYVDKNANGFSFYLGYYFHLLTDIAFAQYFRKITAQIRSDADLVQKVIQDYQNQDFIYLKNNTDSIFFTTFSTIEVFENNYLDFFSKDAFTNRIHYITNNYLSESKHIVSEFPKIYKVDLDIFINETIPLLQEVYNSI